MIIEGSRVVSALFFDGMKRWRMLILCQDTEFASNAAPGLGSVDVDIYGGLFLDSIA